MTHCARIEARCGRCDGSLPFQSTMAFQPIVDVAQATIIAYEALVRGPEGQTADSILAQVDDHVLYRFDQTCRVRAIELANHLDMQQVLSINLLPNAVYAPSSCIQATLASAQRLGWPTQRINFEIVETEYVTDRNHLRGIIDTYREMGFTTALDDFGAGYANLDLLTELAPDTLKLDRQLIRRIHKDSRRQAIIRAIDMMARDLDIQLIAEGVETIDEARWLADHGIHKQQGFFFARPALERLPLVSPERFAAVKRD